MKKDQTKKKIALKNCFKNNKKEFMM